MAVNGSPTIRRRRLGAELRRLRHAAGMTHQHVAGRLLVSQSRISLLETGRRAINPRDVRDLCELYEVTDELIVGSLMRMAKESGRQGWWVAYGDVPYGIYIGMETEAASIHSYEPLVPPDCSRRAPTLRRSSPSRTLTSRSNRPLSGLSCGCSGNTAPTTPPAASGHGRSSTNPHCGAAWAPPRSCGQCGSPPRRLRAVLHPRLLGHRRGGRVPRTAHQRPLPGKARRPPVPPHARPPAGAGPRTGAEPPVHRRRPPLLPGPGTAATGPVSGRHRAATPPSSR